MTSWSRGPAATHAQLTYLKEDQLKMASINPSHSCRDQEGRRGPDVVVPGTSVFSSSQTSVLRNF